MVCAQGYASRIMTRSIASVAAGLMCTAEMWISEDRINRLERCRVFLVSEGMLAPHEDLEVIRRIQSFREMKEVCEYAFEEQVG